MINRLTKIQESSEEMSDRECKIDLNYEKKCSSSYPVGLTSAFYFLCLSCLNCLRGYLLFFYAFHC